MCVYNLISTFAKHFSGSYIVQITLQGNQGAMIPGTVGPHIALPGMVGMYLLQY